MFVQRVGATVSVTQHHTPDNLTPHHKCGWLLCLLDDDCHKIPIDPFYEQQHDVMGRRGYQNDYRQ